MLANHAWFELWVQHIWAVVLQHPHQNCLIRAGVIPGFCDFTFDHPVKFCQPSRSINPGGNAAASDSPHGRSGETRRPRVRGAVTRQYWPVHRLRHATASVFRVPMSEVALLASRQFSASDLLRRPGRVTDISVKAVRPGPARPKLGDRARLNYDLSLY